MNRCLELAAGGRYSTPPNPMVGAVLVADGRIIGEGYHRAYGLPHAEVDALNRIAPQDRPLIREATLYVNLEPCSHHGKTPPCAERIVSEGIPRVIVGMQDPNPLVSGKGLELLRNAGIEVIENVLRNDCAHLNQAFVTRMRTGRPWVLLKWAQSADGFLAGPDGETIRFTDAWSDRMVHHWRASCASILVGAKTVINDNPMLTPRLAGGYYHLKPGDNRPDHPLPTRVVLDRYGLLSLDSTVFDHQAPTILVRPPDLPPERYLVPDIEVLAINPDKEFIPKLLHQLASRNIISIMVEGGAETLRHFIEGGFWNEARIFKTAGVLGDGLAAPIPSGKLSFRTDLGHEVLEIWHPKS
jgi:diaminohydroxyphosphoribosylaminopyrimidine deaminase / 5-amino-6-(5-phosphoribosylamino)uracil reductase